MWRDLLGVDEVGARDDFFELGGQSLIAVRLFSRIRKKHGVDLPLATLFESPTIEQCAAVVARAAGVDDSPGRGRGGGRRRAEAPRAVGPAVARLPIRRPHPARRSARAALLHPRRGRQRPQLPRSSARSRANSPSTGLQARGIDGVEPPHASIEEMAAAYLPEIRAVQPEGPYLLAGYSGGGLVALEIARALDAVGERVDFLGFIDTFIPLDADRAHHDAEPLRAHA